MTDDRKSDNSSKERQQANDEKARTADTPDEDPRESDNSEGEDQQYMTDDDGNQSENEGNGNFNRATVADTPDSDPRGDVGDSDDEGGEE